jgi:hypothetical protein
MNACLNVESLVRWRPKSSGFYTSNASEPALWIGRRLAEFAVDRFGRPFAPMEIAKIAARIAGLAQPPDAEVTVSKG